MTNLPLTGIFNITAIFKQVNKNLWKTLGFHTGIDFTGSDSIYSTCDGIIDSINYSNAYGNYIIIKEDEASRYHYFCHLKSVKVKKGQRVNRATIIGIMGATGNVTGKHLHYEIRKTKGNLVESNLVNPAEYCQIPNAKGTYNSINYPVEKNANKYKAGDVVETSFQVRVIGEIDPEHYKVESNGYKFELHKTMIKNLNKDNIGDVIERGTIFAQINEDTYGIEVLDRQFNIKEYYISKKL